MREIAWPLIKYRMDKGLSREQPAELVGTSHSQISRIESGRHRTNLNTPARIAHGLDMRMVVGFETTTPGGRTKRDLVAFEVARASFAWPPVEAFADRRTIGRSSDRDGVRAPADRAG